MSLKFRLLTAFSALALIASGCATSQQNQPAQAGGSSTVEELPTEEQPQGQAEAAPAPAPVPAASTVQFATVGGPDDGFTVKMPGAPQVARNKVTIASGDVNIATWNSNVEGVIYALTATEYPVKFVATRAPETLLNKEGRDVLVGQLKGTLKSEENLTINDTYPGKAFVIASDQGEVKARSYLVGPRLYTMLALYNPSIGAPAADEFLRSLALINPPPRVERATKGAATPAPATPAPATPAPGTPAPSTTGGTPPPPTEGAK
jgi:hypothetical protein